MWRPSSDTPSPSGGQPDGKTHLEITEQSTPSQVWTSVSDDGGSKTTVQKSSKTTSWSTQSRNFQSSTQEWSSQSRSQISDAAWIAPRDIKSSTSAAPAMWMPERSAASKTVQKKIVRTEVSSETPVTMRLPRDQASNFSRDSNYRWSWHPKGSVENSSRQVTQPQTYHDDSYISHDPLLGQSSQVRETWHTTTPSGFTATHRETFRQQSTTTMGSGELRQPTFEIVAAQSQSYVDKKELEYKQAIQYLARKYTFYHTIFNFFLWT